MRGVDSAFYVSPHETNEIEIATIFGQEAERAGARLVFGGFHIEDADAREAAGGAIPAYVPKLELAAFLASTDTRPAMFSLTNFAQNDEIFREDIEGRRLPDAAALRRRQPDRPARRGRGPHHRADRRELLRLLYQLVGPESLNGEQSARIWAEALGREVVYTGDDPQWREAFAKRLEGRKLEDWIRSFELLGGAAIPTDPADVETMTKLLGHPPRTLRDYVRDSVS